MNQDYQPTQGGPVTKLHFGYQDLFRSFRLGFSAKKLGMALIGLLFGLVGYSGLSYLSYITAGYDWLTIWQLFRLLPLPMPDRYPWPWYSWFVYSLGLAWFLVVMLVTGTALAKVTLEQLRGDEFYEARSAWRYALERAPTILLSPLVLGAFIALIVALGLLLALIGLIPQLGPFIVAIAAFPAWLAALLILYLLIVLALTLILAPAIVATTNSDTFDTLFEAFSCLNEQPGRTILYTATTAILAKIGGLLFGVAATIAGRIAYHILHPILRDTLTDLLTNAASYLLITIPDRPPYALGHTLLRVTADHVWHLPQLYTPFTSMPTSWAIAIAGPLLSLTYYTISLLTIAYALTTWHAGLTLTYITLAHKKDQRNLLTDTA